MQATAFPYCPFVDYSFDGGHSQSGQVSIVYVCPRDRHLLEHSTCVHDIVASTSAERVQPPFAVVQPFGWRGLVLPQRLRRLMAFWTASLGY